MWWLSIYLNHDNISGHIIQHGRPDNICGFLLKPSLVFHCILKSLQTQHDPEVWAFPPYSHTISYWSKKHLISLTMMYYLLKKKIKKKKTTKKPIYDASRTVIATSFCWFDPFIVPHSNLNLIYHAEIKCLWCCEHVNGWLHSCICGLLVTAISYSILTLEIQPQNFYI